MRLSITARLVSMFALAALVTFVLIGSVLYLVLRGELLRQQDNDLAAQLQNMEYTIERTGNLERWARVQAKMDTLAPADAAMRFWVFSADPVFGYGRDGEAIRATSRLAASAPITVEVPGRSAPMRIRSNEIAAFQDRPAVRLVIGVDSAPFAHTLRRFVLAMVAVSLTAVLLVMAIGHWIARVGLNPLGRLSRDARSLQPAMTSQRLHLADLPVELSDLGVAFNGALERLEAAYHRLDAFNADVAHELRTPLANMIGSTQVALSRPRSAVELQETLQSNLEELDRLRAIINDMLFLARADRGEAATHLVLAPVVDEVRKTIEFFEVVLDETQMRVEIEGDLGARATLETALFRRAMSNLLQNSMEHSARGARLVVHIAERLDKVWITVANPGQPIAAVHLDRLFDRFYRVDAARHDGGEHHGHGLGLAIVKAVAAMHGGGVTAASADGVTTIGFSVPRADSPASG